MNDLGMDILGYGMAIMIFGTVIIYGSKFVKWVFGYFKNQKGMSDEIRDPEEYM